MVVPVNLVAWQLPSIAVGTGSWGHPYPPVSQEEAVNLVEFSLAKGRAFFDTAPSYARGLSEQWLGIGLRGVPRDHFIVSTKAGRFYNKKGKISWDWSRDGILRSVESSCKRLGLDTIDILHLHDLGWQPQQFRQALDESYPVLVELREQGIIRAIGAGVTQTEVLLDLTNRAQFDCFLLAGRYTLLEQGALPLLDTCRDKHIAVLIGGVYNSGILATGAVPGARYEYHKAPLAVLERVRKIEEVCARHNVPLRAAALQFPLGHPAVVSLVIGSSSVAELEDTLSLQCQSIPASLWTDLQSEGLLDPAAPLPGELCQ
jgi:D-threo-aldose 1-dehydrogenase